MSQKKPPTKQTNKNPTNRTDQLIRRKARIAFAKGHHRMTEKSRLEGTSGDHLA